jgi:hypothetical protein
MKSKWLVPFKRNHRNYEDVGEMPYLLEHDRGFAGDKLYRACKVLAGGQYFARVLTVDGTNEQIGPFYHRRDALAAIRREKLRAERDGIEAA